MHTMKWIRRRRRRWRRWWWYDSDRSAVWSVSRAYIFALTLIMPIHTSTAATAYHIEFHYLIVEFWSSLVSNENIVRHAIAVRLCGVKCRSVFALTFVLHACNWLYTHTQHIRSVLMQSYGAASMDFGSKELVSPQNRPSRTRFKSHPNSTVRIVITVCCSVRSVSNYELPKSSAIFLSSNKPTK